METENHEIKDKLIITSSGLQGSKRIKNDSTNDGSVYFGSKESEEEPVNYIYIIKFFFVIYRMIKLTTIYQL